RSSGINEDNYGDAQAGKYLSLVQGEEDIVRTCLKVMASGYRPELCLDGIPPSMALIIQHCIDCLCGGVATSFQSFQDNTVRFEFTRGQPRAVVAGQSGNTPHRIDISRKDGAESYQYFPGTISSHFILVKNKNGYSETRIDDVDARANDMKQLIDDMISNLMPMVTALENLLLCPVDVEFAIDHEGHPYPVQVRPVTRLSGDMDFAMPIPTGAIASGESVSEGYCTGTIWLAEERNADSMPDGAIVVAPHAENWMLDPEFLKRVGGFVIARGGSNDHVAIIMRQAGITLMLAGEQYKTVAAQAGQQATLACARFCDEPGAFIVTGDISGKLASHRNLASAITDVPQAKATPSRDDLSFPEGAFLQVASGFKWLTDQNARLLGFFASGGGLDCLANPVKLSMSPQRSRILAETAGSINRLVYGAEALLEGYRAFLRLAGEGGSSAVRLLQDAQQLGNRFETLQQTIRSGLKSIILPMQAAEEGRLFPGTFRQWTADCGQLKSSLQTLRPYAAEKVQSVHELIFALHKRFVKALAPVTLDSGQARLSSEEGRITYVDCTTPDETAPLLNASCKAALRELDKSAIVISMDDAMIVSLNLGHHVGLIELLEHADGGKERTLRLKLSDTFFSTDGSDNPCKLQRMWFLVQLLKAIELVEEADNMKISFNAVAGEMIVECPRMGSRPIMQHAFVKLVAALYPLNGLDIFLSSKRIFKENQWNFNSLAQRLDRDAEANRFAFQHCLFLMVDSVRKGINASCYQFLGNHQQQFIDHALRLVKSDDNLWEVLMSDEVARDIRRELLHHLLLLYPAKAMQFVEFFYPQWEDHYFIIERPHDYSLKFHFSPVQSLGDHKEKVRNLLLKNTLKYASQRVRNDKDLVLSAVELYPCHLSYVSEKLKRDEDVVMTAINADYLSLKYASQELRDNEEFIRGAIKIRSAAMLYAGEKVRNDKRIIENLMAVNIRILRSVNKSVLKDREYMLALIKKDADAFNFIADELEQDTNFIISAIEINSDVCRVIRINQEIKPVPLPPEIRRLLNL
ncbi:DUF4116 domain-containing protein, partial [Endozoicomonas sp. ONNA2]|uniref:DUF4116 domain-containing protein n=1 Tax=Endozoicomonas sp. ONNA2 TaxID=2828741 RepID=UPI002147E545